MQSVKETAKGLKFPKNIPRERSKNSIGILILSVSFIPGAFYFSGNSLLLVNALPIMIVFLGCSEILHRLWKCFEEMEHLTSRYNNSVMTLMKDAFCMPSRNAFLVLISSVICIFSSTVQKEVVFKVIDEDWRSTSLLMIGMCLLGKFLKLNDSPLHQSLQFAELEGCDYGSGMAHSFFHGYLRIILPHTGTSEKGLKEFMKDYEARNNINFEVYKLFVLIPFSQFCPPTLSNEFSPSMETSKELESKKVDRAGVKNRNYQNSVYKINIGKRKQYICAEYATPVKTLAEVMRQSTSCSRKYQKHRKEILLNFYLTLRNLIKEDEECCNLCEVIYYNDKIDQENFYDVGEIITNRLKHMKKNK